jgi:hypothetical protein
MVTLMLQSTLPFLKTVYGQLLPGIFQQTTVSQDDNAPVHRARIVQQYKQENDIHSMSWPAQSPDLNIIENVWLHLKRELKKRLSHINTTADLEQEIGRAWTSITPNYVKQLYKSIPRRILRVIRSKGCIIEVCKN